MRTWLAKFRASVALDACEPQRENTRNKGASEEVKQCEESMRALHGQLKAARPIPPVPTKLHASVMRAVRAAADSQKRQSAPWALRWLPAPALAVLVALGLWLSSSRSPQESPSLVVATTALEQGHLIAQKTSGAVLAPLAQEMNDLNRDFQNAVAFLVASVP